MSRDHGLPCGSAVGITFLSGIVFLIGKERTYACAFRQINRNPRIEELAYLGAPDFANYIRIWRAYYRN